MAGQTGRSLQLSAQGIQKANTALLKFGSKADLAAQLQMSRTTINKFFKREPVQQKQFRAICKKLKLILEEVADLPRAVKFELVEQNQNNGSNIDELVREVRSRLRNDIERLHGRILLYGVDGLVPLSDLFVNVNILEQRSSSRRSELDDLWEDFISGDQDAYGYRSFDRMGLGKNLQPIAGDKVLEKDNNLMVVGKPGAGKTTYLQHIVIKCNNGLLQPHRIPVLIKLRDFVRDGRQFEYCLKRYLCWQWRLSSDNTERVLKDGKALILLDGLDEVTGTDGEAIVEQIEYFARTYPQNQLIVTSRTQPQELGFGYFEYVEVDNFNKAQVQDFAYHWFEAIASSTQEGQEKAKQFLHQLYFLEHYQIRELAITPILLSLTCSVFYYRGKFYSQRSKLYQEAVELLLERWDKDRKIERDEIYRELPPGRKQQLLCYLAATKLTKPKYYILFEQDEIEDYIAKYLNCSRQNSKAVLRAMEKQHGLLIERAQGIWSFSHLTFQEYFAAKWFVENADWQDLVNNHITENNWREIFLLTVQMLLQDIDSMLQLMKNKVDGLVASDQKLQQFLTWINQKSLSVETPYKLTAVRALYLTLSSSLRFNSHFNSTINLLGFGFDLAEALGFWFSSNLIDAPNLDHAPDLDLDFNLWRALNFAFDLNCDSDIDLAVTIDLSLETLNYDLAINLALERFRKLDRALTNALTSTQISDSELQQLLQQLKNQLPEPEGNRELFWEWRQANGKAWTEQLRAVIVQHRNIGHDWQFNEQQKQLLKQYYDANKLLVDSLKMSCSVSDGIRKEIKETLLLSIIEIKKRQQHMQITDVAGE